MLAAKATSELGPGVNEVLNKFTPVTLPTNVTPPSASSTPIFLGDIKLAILLFKGKRKTSSPLPLGSGANQPCPCHENAAEDDCNPL